MNRLKRFLPLLFLLLGACFLCTGCIKEITLDIDDNGMKSETIGRTDMTIGQVLEGAGVTVSEKDSVQPVLSEKVTEEMMAITIRRYAAVTIISEKQTWKTEILGGTVQDALDEAGVTLGEGQYVREDEEAMAEDGMEVHIITQAKIRIIADGEEKTIFTEAKTVGDVLDEIGLKVGKKDRVKPKLSKAIDSGVKKIQVKRVKVKKEKVVEDIPFETATEYSSRYDKGTTRTSQTGVNGKKEIIYKVTYVDGVEESRTVVKETVLEEPVTEIIVVGTYVEPEKPAGPTVVSKEKVPNCDDPSHGYWIITYSDGTVEYVEY